MYRSIQAPRDYSKARIPKPRTPIVKNFLEDVLSQELRQPVLGWYLGGVHNRQTRRAVLAVKRSSKVREAMLRVARFGHKKRAVRLNALPVPGQRTFKRGVINAYNSIKSKFNAFRRQQG